jgi:hypothetical protein
MERHVFSDQFGGVATKREISTNSPNSPSSTPSRFLTRPRFVTSPFSHPLRFSLLPFSLRLRFLIAVYLLPCSN